MRQPNRFQTISAWVVLAHSAAFLAYWLTNFLFKADVNDFLADMLGARRDYVMLLVAAYGVVALWSAVRLALLYLGVSHALAKVTAWLYGILGALFVLVFYGSFIMLFREDPTQVARLEQILVFDRLALDAIVVIGLAFICAFAADRWKKRLAQKSATKRKSWLPALLLAPFLALWAGLAAFPPASVASGEIPPKPRLISHRGASMLAPENTIAAMQRALTEGAYGVETDIRMSKDGVLFLMHDATLERTTNVAEVFPERKKERAENFTMAELKQLNAGSWFTQDDRYGSIAAGLDTPAQAAEYDQQRIPTLAEMLDFLKTNDLIFIFDLLQPPYGHPYFNTYFNQCLQQIKAAGIDSRVWYLASPFNAELLTVKAAAPQMIRAIGNDASRPMSAEDIVGYGFQLVNSGYQLKTSLIQEYRQAGLWVNLWVVDEPWQFSRLWLQGVDSMTTNNVQGLAKMSAPTLSTSRTGYFVLWAALGLLGAAGILWKALKG